MYVTEKDYFKTCLIKRSLDACSDCEGWSFVCFHNNDPGQSSQINAFSCAAGFRMVAGSCLQLR